MLQRQRSANWMQCFTVVDKQVLVSNAWSPTETAWISFSFFRSLSVSTALAVKYKSIPTQNLIMSGLHLEQVPWTWKQCFSHPGLWTEVQTTANNMSIQQRSFQSPPCTKCCFKRQTGTKNKLPHIEVHVIVLNLCWNEHNYTLHGDIGKPSLASLTCGALIDQEQTQTTRHRLPSCMHML